MLHDGKRRSAFPNFSCKNFDSTSSPKKKFAGSIKTFSAMFSTKCSMQQICFLYLLVVLERANSSFIEFQTVEFKHVSSSTFARVFRVLARVIRVFEVFSSSSLAEFEF